MDIRVVDVEYNDDDGYDVHAYLKVSEDTTEEDVEDYLYDHGNIEVYVNGFETLNVKNASKYKDYDFVTYVDEPDDSIFEGVARNFSDALIEEYTLDEDGYQFSIDDYKADGELKRQAEIDSINALAMQKQNQNTHMRPTPADRAHARLIADIRSELLSLPKETLRDLLIRVAECSNRSGDFRAINRLSDITLVSNIMTILFDVYLHNPDNVRLQKAVCAVLEPYYPEIGSKVQADLEARAQADAQQFKAKVDNIVQGVDFDTMAPSTIDRARRLARERDPEIINRE